MGVKISLPGPIPEPTEGQREQARATVDKQAKSPSEAKEIKKMLGLDR